jgi:hypothetical protein
MLAQSDWWRLNRLTSDANKEKLLDRSEAFEEWTVAKWDPFVAEMLPGDELWRFSSPKETWANFMGRSGYSIVRKGTIVRSLVTMMN